MYFYSKIQCIFLRKISIYHNQLGYGSLDNENHVLSCTVISHQLFLDTSSYPQPTSRAKNKSNNHKKATTNHCQFHMQLCHAKFRSKLHSFIFLSIIKVTFTSSQKLHRQRIFKKMLLRLLHCIYRISNRD